MVSMAMWFHDNVKARSIRYTIKHQMVLTQRLAVLEYDVFILCLKPIKKLMKVMNQDKLT